LQLNGIVFLGSGTRFIAVPDNRNQNLQSLSDVLEAAEHLLTPAAIANRQRRRPADDILATHFERLAESASQELATLVGKNG
jgi:hypothetical protein